MSSLNQYSSAKTYSSLIYDALHINNVSKPNEFKLFKESFQKAIQAASVRDASGKVLNVFASEFIQNYNEEAEDFVAQSPLVYSILYDRNLTNLMEVTLLVGNLLLNMF